MGLSFVEEKDQKGAAVIFLYDGREMQRQKLDRIKSEIEQRGSQVYLLSTEDEDGEEVRDFYDIDAEQMPAGLIVRDNDEVVALWYDQMIPPVDQIIYQLDQVG
ncbi:hypothetical protein KBC31_03645 [Candidatus Saccharibacteria bacterium]|nr:hypothetical protein [Candidatus Saccharibacteria bacterium]